MVQEPSIALVAKALGSNHAGCVGREMRSESRVQRLLGQPSNLGRTMPQPEMILWMGAPVIFPSPAIRQPKRGNIPNTAERQLNSSQTRSCQSGGNWMQQVTTEPGVR